MTSGVHPTDGEQQRRDVGVAIGLPEPHSSQLQGWRTRLGDPNAAAIPPHVTLLPPTAVAQCDLPGIEEHLRRVARECAPFEIHLRGSGTFRPVSPVVFVPLTAGISNCEQLERRVRSGPLQRAARFPYHPHVTVAHDVPDEVLDRGYCALAGYQARFRVWGFSLFEQGPDGMWRPLRDFPFGRDLSGPQVSVDAGGS